MSTDSAIEEILAICSPEIRQLAEALRKLVRKAVPQAEERGIKGWKVIAYSRDGIFCGIQPQRNWVNLIFYRGAELLDPEGLLTGTGKGIRAVKVKKPQDIKEPVKTLVKEAFKLGGESTEVRGRGRPNPRPLPETGRGWGRGPCARSISWLDKR